MMDVSRIHQGYKGVERVTIRAMSAESKDEIYCVAVLMMKLCGLIHLPPYLHSSYHNINHSMDGAIRRMRWAVPRMTSYLGSDPATHIIFRYNVMGLPSHLREFSKAVPRLNPSPPGLRNIDSRLSPRKEAARNSSRTTRGAPSTSRRTRTATEDTTPRADNRRSTEDTTPRADNRKATEDTRILKTQEKQQSTRWNLKP